MVCFLENAVPLNLTGWRNNTYDLKNAVKEWAHWNWECLVLPFNHSFLFEMTRTYSSKLRLELFPFPINDITLNWPSSSKSRTDLTWMAKQSLSCYKKEKTWSRGTELKIPLSFCGDGLLVSFSFVLCLLRLSQYLDFFSLQCRIIATWKKTKQAHDLQVRI